MSESTAEVRSASVRRESSSVEAWSDEERSAGIACCACCGTGGDAMGAMVLPTMKCGSLLRARTDCADVVLQPDEVVVAQIAR